MEQSRPILISLIGATLTGNRGAEAMVRAAVQGISDRRPDAEFSLLSLYPDEDAAENSDPRIAVVPCSPAHLLLCALPVAALVYLLRCCGLPVDTVARLSRPVREICRSMILIDLSGVSFMDRRGLGILAYNAAVVLLPKFAGTPIIKYSQALGPFNDRLNAVCSRLLLPKVDILVARGNHTRKLLQELGVDGPNVHVCADAAFAMRTDEAADREAARLTQHPAFCRDVVAVVPSSVVDGMVPQYAEETASFIAWLADQKHYGILIAAHSARPGRNSSKNNDLPLCAKIRSLLPDRKEVLCVDHELNAAVLRCLIGRSRFMMTSRFHAMISAIVMNVPTVLIGWSHKYEEVLEPFRLAHLTLDSKQFSSAELQRRFIDLEENEAEVRRAMRDHLPAVIESSLDNARLAVSLAEARLRELKR